MWGVVGGARRYTPARAFAQALPPRLSAMCAHLPACSRGRTRGGGPPPRRTTCPTTPGCGDLRWCANARKGAYGGARVSALYRAAYIRRFRAPPNCAPQPPPCGGHYAPCAPRHDCATAGAKAACRRGARSCAGLPSPAGKPVHLHKRWRPPVRLRARPRSGGWRHICLRAQVRWGIRLQLRCTLMVARDPARVDAEQHAPWPKRIAIFPTVGPRPSGWGAPELQ